MGQADSGSPASRAWWSRLAHNLPVAIIAGVVAGALITALIFLAVRRDTPATASADTGTAMCRAVPVADQVLPSIVTISARRGAQSGTGSGQIFKAGGYILTN